MKNVIVSLAVLISSQAFAETYEIQNFKFTKVNDTQYKITGKLVADKVTLCTLTAPVLITDNKSATFSCDEYEAEGFVASVNLGNMISKIARVNVTTAKDQDVAFQHELTGEGRLIPRLAGK